MFEIVKLDPMTLSALEKKAIFELHQNVIQTYNHLNKTVTIESFESEYLATFCSDERQLFLMKSNDVLKGILTYTKGANWRGEVQYQMHLLAKEEPSLSDAEYLVNWIKPFIALHGELAIIHYNEAFATVLKALNSQV